MASPQGFELYPPLEERHSGRLRVDALHELYWEESGNPAGIPVVYVHGGPGGGASPEKRQWFDPAAYRIILFDQRGSYRSTPLGEVRDNSTQALVEDMEALRKLLSVDRWLLAGGSWGTTLSLAYGQTYPDSCLGFILRGVFLGSAEEIDWFLYGMGRFFPKAHRDFATYIPEDERDDLLSAYERRLFSDDPELRLSAATRWYQYTEACSLLRHDPGLVEQASKNRDVVYGVGRLDACFFRNDMFLRPRQLLEDVGRISHLPAMIVQGGHDVIAPPQAACALHAAWPGSLLHIVPDAGHSPLEPGIRAKLIEALDQFKYDLHFDAARLQPSGPV